MHRFGRTELVDREALGRLVRSISRLLDPAGAVAGAGSDADVRALDSRTIRACWVSYKNTELRAELEKLRGPQTGPRRVTAPNRASDASSRQRNATPTAANKRLRAENSEFEDELAALLGEGRAATPSTPRTSHTS